MESSSLLKLAQILAARLDTEPAATDVVLEARALCEYIAEVGYLFYPPANDHTLFSFVSILYLASLGPEEREGLRRSLPPASQVACDLVVEFAGELLGHNFGACDGDDEVGKPLQMFWERFCGSKGVRVGVDAADPHRPGELVMEDRPLEPVRPPLEPLYFGWQEGGGSPLHGGGKGSAVTLAVGLDDVPNILDLVCKLTESDYFFYLPVKNLGWNLRTHTELRDTVEEYYSKLEGDRNALPRVPPAAYPCVEVTASPLRVSEARLLLRGIQSNQLLRSLLLHRPPHSTLPHYYTIVNASAHARLWLGRYDLPIYYDYSLTYGELCTRGAASAEEEALNGGFLVERGPSVVETVLRHNTLNHMWKEGPTAYEKLVHMRPEDYEPLPEEAVAQDENLWKALQQLRHAVVATPSYAWGHALSTAVFMYAKHFPLEPEAKRKFLFRHGVPKHFGTLQVFDTILKLSQPLDSVAIKERTCA